MIALDFRGHGLSEHRDTYTYADIVGFVYVGFAARALRGATPLEGRPALKDWHERVAARPAIERASNRGPSP